MRLQAFAILFREKNSGREFCQMYFCAHPPAPKIEIKLIAYELHMITLRCSRIPRNNRCSSTSTRSTGSCSSDNERGKYRRVSSNVVVFVAFSFCGASSAVCFLTGPGGGIYLLSHQTCPFITRCVCVLGRFWCCVEGKVRVRETIY